MTTTIEILTAARDLLSDERRWTKGDTARDEIGRDVDYFAPEAVSWCLLGACYKASKGGFNDPKVWDAQHLLIDVMSGSFVDFNDSPYTTHADVLKSPLGMPYQNTALDLVPSVVGGHIAEFNDDPNTTHADILQVLDAAIKKAKQDG